MVVEGGRIFSDGVNAAARVQARAEGGGICLSGSAFDQVEGKLALSYESLGEQAVKNIARPFRMYERAVSLQPNASYAGRPEEAIEAARTAMRLAPRFPAYYVAFLGGAYRVAGRYEEAIAASRRWHELNPSGSPAHASIAICLLRLGREAEARAAVTEVLKAQPSFTLASWARGNPYRNPGDLERDLADLRRLGFK